MKYRNPHWSIFDKLGLVLVSLFLIFWLLIPSSLFYKPHSVEIVGSRVIVVRDFPLSPPFKPPFVSYAEVVRPLGPTYTNPYDVGRICDMSAEFPYKDNGKAFATWDIVSWAAPCIQGDFIWQATWTVKLFGVIPLRPVSLETIVIRGEQQ